MNWGPVLMTKALTAVCDALTRAVGNLLGILIGAIVLITLAAVWWRYIINDPISWTEQVSRILFVWVTFLGAAVLYREKSHITIDMFLEMIPQPLKSAVVWMIEFGMLLFIVVLFFYGLKLSLDTMSQTYGALDITPASFYFAAPVSAGLMMLFFIERLVDPSKRGPGHSTTIL
jgi:TRAP-type transport system small permease protein